MGYPPKNRHPAARAPSAQATSPVIKCSPVKTAAFINDLPATEAKPRFFPRGFSFEDLETFRRSAGSRVLSVISLLRRGLYRIDGEIRTDGFTVMAIDTGFGFFHHGGVVPLHIVFGGHLEDIPRAIGDAVTASLTPFFDDVNDSACDLNFIDIQRNAPVFHASWSSRVRYVES
jgi:hypothetical protein